MDQKILNEIKIIEITENVKILYAVESGSRAWGFPSPDSDYDVRFIYVRPQAWYLSIQPGRDVIEYPISDLLDISGWDLKKTLQLLRKSNPSLLEWLHSPIVYYSDGKLVEDLKDLATQSFSQKALLYHYLNMAKSNFRSHLQGDDVKIKKYFYVLRPLLACLWLRDKQEIPPILFDDLLTLGEIPDEVFQEIQVLLAKKEISHELALEPQIPCLNSFIEDNLTEIKHYIATLPADSPLSYPVLNEIFNAYL